MHRHVNVWNRAGLRAEEADGATPITRNGLSLMRTVCPTAPCGPPKRRRLYRWLSTATGARADESSRVLDQAARSRRDAHPRGNIAGHVLPFHGIGLVVGRTRQPARRM